MCDSSQSTADVLIIGGGPAGSNAAWELGQAHHRVILFNASIDRLRDPDVNTASTRPALDLLLHSRRKTPDVFRPFRQEIGKESSEVSVHNQRITQVQRLPNGFFQAEDDVGHVWTAKVLVLADGAEEILPDIDGYDTCWEQQRILTHPAEDEPRSLISSCLAVLAVGDLAELTMALHTVWQARQFAASVRVYTHGDEDLARALETRISPDARIAIQTTPIQSLQPGSDSPSQVVVHLADGSSIVESHVYHRPASQLQGPFARQLNLELTESGAIRISARVPYMTSLDGVYAGGDCASLGQRTLFKALAMGQGLAAAVAARLERGNWGNAVEEQD
ncbi:hypothetical protein AFCA_010978 [Aspergillus flavus]|uniref:Thioredoxin reductase aclT n=3 Tax=Aspergillus subgen. Circumdati TaxID=2720871 RepID=ACLT_ASPOR|nr:unnamed protein product [Aspergillus oryzae RIB40]Q2UPB4.1 RecName: Full=Thioredoxin reductase aclT; AltName: Full=Aspirochlorine biosynthesis protein T [Aspergillus oryzae RIB40]KAJ1712036.1 hypothetical protein NYO67_5805 [Aspergillus flavus]OOO09512.1 thioredoxin reductase [Aspergillus oryzae]RMZ44744.1 thioredoxin reductase [Aspergillus flavus]UDD63717.1 hypothetical protein AFCA_010978 [Aspergillus flavus]BAE56601.1 unnamed protein product [Aspergillus oryzae RIB40]